MREKVEEEITLQLLKACCPVISKSEDPSRKIVFKRLMFSYLIILQGFQQKNSPLHRLHLDTVRDIFLHLVKLHIEKWAYFAFEDYFITLAFFTERLLDSIYHHQAIKKNFHLAQHGFFYNLPQKSKEENKNLFLLKKEIASFIIQNTLKSKGHVLDVFMDETEKLSVYFSCQEALDCFKEVCEYHQLKPDISKPFCKASLEKKDTRYLMENIFNLSIKPYLDKSYKNEKMFDEDKKFPLHEALKGTLVLLVSDENERLGTVSAIELKKESLTVCFDHPEAMQRFLEQCAYARIAFSVSRYSTEVTFDKKGMGAVIETLCKLSKEPLMEEIEEEPKPKLSFCAIL